MSENKVSDVQKRTYAGEFRTLVDWTSGAGLTRMGMVFNMVLPGIQSDEQGIAEVTKYVSKAHEEGFSPDAGVPSLEMLVATAEHLRPFGAPIPSWEARRAMNEGHLTRIPL